MMHYVGQQQRERQGWGNKNKAEECVKTVRVSMYECVHKSCFPVISASCAHTDDVQFIRCQIQPLTAEISAGGDLRFTGNR